MQDVAVSPERISSLIKQARGREGINQQEAAQRSGVKYRTYGAYERGEIDSPSAEKVQAIASALHIEELSAGGEVQHQSSGDGAARDLGGVEGPDEKQQLEDVMRRQTKLTVYPDVRPQCGDGNIIFDQATKVEVQMPALLLEKLLGFRPPPVMGMMMCQGDSMSPVFEEDDPLLYRPSPDVDSDGNYSFYLDDRLRAKRVEVIPGGGYKLISANTRAGYGHYRLVPGNDGKLVNAETENAVGFQPVGKILWPRRDTGRLNVDQVADLLHSVVQQNS